MKSNSILLIAICLFAGSNVHAQDEAAATEARMQFSSVILGTNNSFAALRGPRLKDDENFVYYDSDRGLGSKFLTILNSKADTTEWYCFVRFHMIDDLKDVVAVESGVFGLLNMIIGGGKIKGSEGTEGKITRTDLYVTENNAWLGELVSDSEKQTFHIFMKNTKWR